MQGNGRGNQYRVPLKYNILQILTCEEVTTVIPKSFAIL